jgi:ATP-dependent Clp protease ATP-binding subunit ClpC
LGRWRYYPALIFKIYLHPFVWERGVAKSNFEDLMDDIDKMTNWDDVLAGLDEIETGATTRIDEAELLAHLSKRVKGQDAILRDMAKFICVQAAKETRDKPIANLIFLGPTATGKTELAKALAEFLFKDEKAMIRFDGGEFTSADSISRLIGSSVGYIGSEQGGQLTRPVMANPRRLIVFDEIDKAHPSISDLFLGLMGEARVTEQATGKTVNYSQCVIILTSNAHYKEIGEIQNQITDYHEMVNAVKGYMAETKDFRPEILGRVDKVYVFRPLEGIVLAQIAVLKLSNLANEYKLTLEYVAPDLVIQALKASQKRNQFGIRDLKSILDGMFGEQLMHARRNGATQVRLVVGDDGTAVIRNVSQSGNAALKRPDGLK